MEKPLYVAFLWHMHQPYYKNTDSNEYLLPWVRLHGIKDYYHIPAILKEFDHIYQTFNLVPSLSYQIKDYSHSNATDRHLMMTEFPASSLTSDQRDFILENFFNANWEHMIYPYPRYSELLKKKRARVPFNTEDFIDLAVWANLAWMSTTIIREDALLKKLVAKGKGFTEEEKGLLIQKEYEILKLILPTYKKLMEDGRIEITTSPYYHPILPLLCDTSSAQIAMGKNIPLPANRFMYADDAKLQITSALKYHFEEFGVMPTGIWPSEGAVSSQIVPLIADANIRWFASDEEILLQSLRYANKKIAHDFLYKPYKIDIDGAQIMAVFRDQTISDMISFTYHKWLTSDAVSDFIGRLYRIRKMLPPTEDYLITIIMDGENAWEYYPKNGEEFLKGIYAQLENNSLLKTTTISTYLNEHPVTETLNYIHPGSWIEHNFRMWIGSPQKNLAWDYLTEARIILAVAESHHPDSETVKKAKEHIFIAEGSDWFWWFGDESGSIKEFDLLFRKRLMRVYTILGHNIPTYLYRPLGAET